MHGTIWYAVRENSGWIVIRGIIGARRYLYYSMAEAKARYRAEVREKRVKLSNSVIYVK